MAKMRCGGSPCRSSHVLNQAQVEQFRSEGYLSRVPLLPGEEVARLRPEVDAALQGRGPTDDPRVHRHLDDPLTFGLCAQPALVDCMRALLGPDVVLWHSRYFDKRAGDTHIPWHQDAPFWKISPMRVVSAWIALDPVDQDNGCMHMLPGSHAEELPHVHSENTGRFSRKAAPDLVDDRGAVPICLAPGEAVLFDCRMLHRSGINQSRRPRRALSIRFTIPEVTIDVSSLRPPVPGYGVIQMCGTDRLGLNPVAMPPS